jgi:nitroreductase
MVFETRGNHAMQKPAPTAAPIHEFLQNRWSPRAFSDKTVSPEILHALFEAARWAPSSSNYQPWTYIVGTKDHPDDFAKILSTLVEFNAGWARNAPVLVLSVAQTKLPKDGGSNRHAFHDVGGASAQLTFEAVSRGLNVHQMAGFDPHKACEVFAIPPDWEAVAAMAIGYPGDPQSLPAKLRDRELAPRTRKPLSEFVMAGTWGHTPSFASK